MPIQFMTGVYECPTTYFLDCRRKLFALVCTYVLSLWCWWV